MIARLWQGWTREGDADAYERLLREVIFPRIAAKGIAGYRGIHLLRRPSEENEVEFTTIMWFESWQSVRDFAGQDYEAAYVPPEARAVLARFDGRSRHYEVREEIRSGS